MYPKIHRLGHEEVDGILDHDYRVFPKLDGAHMAVQCGSFDDRYRLIVHSRNMPKAKITLFPGTDPDVVLLANDKFRGGVEYVEQNAKRWVQLFFQRFPNAIVFGEWLVPHKVKYYSEFYSRFYPFDIKESANHGFFPYHHPAWDLARTAFGSIIESDPVIPGAHPRDYLSLPDPWGATKREGVVIKAYSYSNRFGQMRYAKIINDEVMAPPKKERDPDRMMSGVVTGIANAYCTPNRIDKIILKVAMDRPGRLEMKDVPEVMSRVFHDLLEEAPHIVKKFKYPIVDFRALRHTCNDIVRDRFVHYLETQ